MQTLSSTEIVLGVAIVALFAGLAVAAFRTRYSVRRQAGPDNRWMAAALGASGEERTPVRGRKPSADQDIRPLTAFRRDRFVQAWRDVRARYDRDPAGAVKCADMLLAEIITARGHSVVEADRGPDLSAPCGEMRTLYATGHRIAQKAVRHEATEGELLRAMVHFGALFDDLVNEPEDFCPVLEYRGEGGPAMWNEGTRRP